VIVLAGHCTRNDCALAAIAAKATMSMEIQTRCDFLMVVQPPHLDPQTAAPPTLVAVATFAAEFRGGVYTAVCVFAIKGRSDDEFTIFTIEEWCLHADAKEWKATAKPLRGPQRMVFLASAVASGSAGLGHS
jgi:hypothetical protein